MKQALQQRGKGWVLGTDWSPKPVLRGSIPRHLALMTVVKVLTG